MYRNERHDETIPRLHPALNRGQKSNLFFQFTSTYKTRRTTKTHILLIEFKKGYFNTLNANRTTSWGGSVRKEQRSKTWAMKLNWTAFNKEVLARIAWWYDNWRGKYVRRRRRNVDGITSSELYSCPNDTTRRRWRKKKREKNADKYVRKRCHVFRRPRRSCLMFNSKHPTRSSSNRKFRKKETFQFHRILDPIRGLFL